MISPDSLQREIINLLKGNTPLVTAIGSEIREDQWQGTKFVYPCVRVDVGLGVPVGDGNCQDTISRVNWVVQAYDENPSSNICGNLIALVFNALFLNQIFATDFSIMTIESSGWLAPYRARSGVWRADAYFMANTYQKRN